MYVVYLDATNSIKELTMAKHRSSHGADIKRARKEKLKALKKKQQLI